MTQDRFKPLLDRDFLKAELASMGLRLGMDIPG